MKTAENVNTQYPTTLDDPRHELRKAFRTFEDRYLDLTEDTMDKKVVYLFRFFDHIGVDEKPDALGRLTRESILVFLTQYASGHGPGSQRWMRYSLRSFLKFAGLNGLTSISLWQWVPIIYTPRLGKVPFCLSEKNIDLVLATVDQAHPFGIRDYTIILILATYGVRQIQVRQLKLEEVDWAGSQILFRAVKGGRTVHDPLTTGVGNSLVAYLQNARPKTKVPELFLNNRGGPLNPGQIAYIVRKHLKNAGIERPEGVYGVGSHQFRHAFATRMLDREVPFKNISDLLGHRNLNSTFIYTKVDHRNLRKACLEWPGVIA